MTSSYIFRYGSIDEKSFLKALNHNKRYLQRSQLAMNHINFDRTSQNYTLHDNKTPSEIENYARSLIALAGIKKLRKNVVMGVEVIYSLPVGWHKQDTKLFFTDCYEWTKNSFAGELLSFDVHLDEIAPHAHAIILPLIDRKMQGDKLKGNRGVIKQRRKAFYDEVASKYGFRYYDLTLLNKSDKLVISRKVLEHLKNDSVQNSVIYSWVRDRVCQDPYSVAQMLGIEISQNKKTMVKHFVDIARSEGRGPFLR